MLKTLFRAKRAASYSCTKTSLSTKERVAKFTKAKAEQRRQHLTDVRQQKYNILKDRI